MIYLIAFFVSFAVAYVTNPTRRSAVFAVFVLAFTFQYSIAIASLMLTYDTTMIAAAWEYRVYALLIVSLAFAAASAVIVILNPQPDLLHQQRTSFGQLNAIIAIFAIVGVFLLLQSTDLANFGSRLSSRSGRGFVFLFGFLAFAGALNFARFSRQNRPKWSWVVLLAAIAFFMVAGYRSFVTLPLLGLALSYFGVSKIIGRGRFALFSGVLAIIAVPINFVTGSIRSLASSEQGEVNYESVVELAQGLAEQQTVPMANTHLDLLAYHLEAASFNEQVFGTASTLVASITNVLPRALFPDKPETTGVVMARQVFPEWFHTGEHTGSVTVGLIFEMIFNFGIPAGIFFFAVFIAGLCVLFRRLIKVPIYGPYCTAVLVWCFFFNIFFDDLGGTINKIVLIIIGISLVGFIHQLRPRKKNRRRSAAFSGQPVYRRRG